jgi:ribosome biogenesis protein MAK21
LTSSPDLSLNTLSHFLDRFVYKNPKSSKNKSTDHGGSLMQSGAVGQGVNGGVMKTKGEHIGAKPVNEESWRGKKVEDVPADEVFYYRFFTNKERRGKGKVSVDEDEDENDEEGFEAESGEEGEGEEDKLGQDASEDGDDEDDDDGEEMDLTGDEAADTPEDADSEDEDQSMDEDEIWKASFFSVYSLSTTSL